MPTTAHLPVRSSGFFRDLGARIANKLFSDQTKRWIFISSIVGLAYPLQDPNIQIAEKINKVFRLVDHPEALELPIYARSVIWKDCDLRVISDNGQSIGPHSLIYGTLTANEATKLVEQVVGQTPWWLRYKTVQDMKADMLRLIEHIQEYDVRATAMA